MAGGRERLSWFGRTVCLAACLLVVACSGAAKRPVAGPRKVVEVVNSRTPGIGALKGPIDVELAPDGTLYVLDYDDRSEVGKIWAVPPKGRARVVWGLDLPGFPGLDERPDPIDMAMGPDGTLYVVDDAGTGIFAVAPDGRRRQVEIQGLPKTHYERMRQLDFTLLQEVTVDPRDGSIYVSQQGGLVRKISRGGVMTRVAGTGSQDGARGNGIPAVSAVIAVDSLAVDPATGTLYRAGSKAGSDLWRRMA